MRLKLKKKNTGKERQLVYKCVKANQRDQGDSINFYLSWGEKTRNRKSKGWQHFSLREIKISGMCTW